MMKKSLSYSAITLAVTLVIGQIVLILKEIQLVPLSCLF